MSTEWSSIERELLGLSPESLDDALLHRLECCAAGDWTTPTTEELCFEAAARKFAPAALNERQMDRFAAVLAGAPFAQVTKVTAFPAAHKTAERKAPRAWWSVAAAVALLGASAAFLVPGKRETAGIAASRPVSPAAADGFVPASFDRDFSGVSDQGVVWSKDNRPHRVVKVGYMERVRLTNPDGRVAEVEQPREQYILVPVSGD